VVSDLLHDVLSPVEEVDPESVLRDVSLHCIVLRFEGLDACEKLVHLDLDVSQLVDRVSELVKVLSYVSHEKAFYVLKIFLQLVVALVEFVVVSHLEKGRV
jgi:hypothetical protein